MYVNEKLIYIGSSLQRSNEKFFQACMVLGPLAITWSPNVKVDVHVLSAGKPLVARISDPILCAWSMVQYHSDCVCVTLKIVTVLSHQVIALLKICSFLVWSNSLSSPVNYIHTYINTIWKRQCPSVGYLLVSGLHSFSFVISLEGNIWNKAQITAYR